MTDATPLQLADEDGFAGGQRAAVGRRDKVPVQGPRVGEMTFQRELLVAGDEDELFHAGGAGLFDRELDDRLVNDRPQLTEPRQRITRVRTRTAHTCDGEERLTNSHRKVSGSRKRQRAW